MNASTALFEALPSALATQTSYTTISSPLATASHLLLATSAGPHSQANQQIHRFLHHTHADLHHAPSNLTDKLHLLHEEALDSMMIEKSPEGYFRLGNITLKVSNLPPIIRD